MSPLDRLRAAPPRAHRVAWLVVAAACAFLAVRGGYKALTTETSDFTIYHAAFRAVLAGEAPSSVHGYLYLPGFAALLAPLGWLPHDVAAVSWQAAGLACLLWSARTLARALRPADAPAWGGLDWLPLLLLLRLVDSNFGNGQVNALTLALIVLAWRRLERGRALEAGAWIGLAGALKLLPLALVALLVQRRAWRATAVALASFALLGLAAPLPWLGVQGTLDALAAWWHGTAEVYVRGGTTLLEAREYLPGQSLVAAGYRLLCDVPGGTWAHSTGLFDLHPDRAAWVLRAASAAHTRAARRRAGGARAAAWRAARRRRGAWEPRAARRPARLRARGGDGAIARAASAQARTRCGCCPAVPRCSSAPRRTPRARGAARASPSRCARCC
ncbi:MAG: DUF2029 domain-containing protein [Planctomycetes bacterium]|nr:DUF2029 domain-containing protein [Planctomycetota bacterium]